jgi:nitrogen fixation-related uncharacterized protein
MTNILRRFLLMIVLSLSCFSIINAWFFWWSSSTNPYEEHVKECGNFWVDCIKDSGIVESDKKASEYLQDTTDYVLTFVYLISVIIIIYSWFHLLTSFGDEEKLKKSKQMIIYVIWWIIIIFIAKPILDFVMRILV